MSTVGEKEIKQIIQCPWKRKPNRSEDYRFEYNFNISCVPGKNLTMNSLIVMRF